MNALRGGTAWHEAEVQAGANQSGFISSLYIFFLSLEVKREMHGCVLQRNQNLTETQSPLF